MKFIVGFAVPVLVIGVSVPLVLGMVAPNGLYGFRTPRTLSSPHIWYRANRAAGWFMIAAGLLVIGVNSLLLISYPDWPENKLVLRELCAFAGGGLTAGAW
jgi:uncharacterized membrane protein